MTRHYVVGDFASPSPVSIGPNQTLADAHRLMREHRVRHLPVLDGGRLVGIVSQRDLYFVETIQGVDPEDMPIGEAMSPTPYVVPRDAALQEVASQMWHRKLGSAVVVDGRKVVGVFTTTDALHALTDLLEPPRRRHEAR